MHIYKQNLHAIINSIIAIYHVSKGNIYYYL